MKKQDDSLFNFERAVKKLGQFMQTPAEDERAESGIIQAFEYSFELSWKALQKKSAREGVPVASPKKAFEYALRAGIIQPSEEPGWIQMLEDRNLITHAYDEKIAKAILARIQKSHYQLLTNLLQRLQSQ